MVLPEALLKILVCPVDKGCLLYFADEGLLYNPRLRRGYRIEKGVPAMLAERAEPVTDHEHERLLSRARDGAAGLSPASPDPPILDQPPSPCKGQAHGCCPCDSFSSARSSSSFRSMLASRDSGGPAGSGDCPPSRRIR